MKYIRFLSRLLVGIVFIFSGFVKAVDPLGSAYKFADYFTAFKLDFLEFLTLPMGIFLSAFEMVLGIILILGYRRRSAFLVLMLFMSFFTLLTFILALFNPVSDCGCFGDALILTNWQTFFKNVVLMVFVLILYFSRKSETDAGLPLREWTVVIGLFVFASLFSFWNYRHLPLLDFRPYDIGTVISEEMEVPEGVEMDEYSTTLIYRSRETGKTSSFTMEDYPKDTLSWEFIDSESKLVKKGYEPPIHDFALMDPSGRDLVEKILSDRGYSLLMISHELRGANEQALINAEEWSQLEVFSGDFSFYAATASTTADVESISSALDLDYPFLAGDEIMLKTIVRSNPGFMLVKNGTIIGKWGFRDFPLLEEVDSQLQELIGNASVPMDEEAELLLDAGITDEFSFDMVEFDRIFPKLLLNYTAARREQGVTIVFILSLLLLLLLSGRISPLRV